MIALVKSIPIIMVINNSLLLRMIKTIGNSRKRQDLRQAQVITKNKDTLP